MEAFLEAPSRFELENKGFADLCLTSWLWCHNNLADDVYHRLVMIGAGYEIRTRDFNLGKVTLYH